MRCRGLVVSVSVLALMGCGSGGGGAGTGGSMANGGSAGRAGAADQTAFPGTPTANQSGYWSSSLQVGNPAGSQAMAWTVYFSYPVTMSNETYVGAYVRCVR